MSEYHGAPRGADRSRFRAGWALPLVPVALSGFLLSAMTWLRLQPAGHDGGRTGIQGVVEGLYEAFGFESLFMVCVLVMTWSSIWFLTGRVDRPLSRLARIGALGLCLAILVNLRVDGTLPNGGGDLGAMLATRMSSVFTPTLSILLVASAAVAALLLATDFFFFGYFERIGSRSRSSSTAVGSAEVSRLEELRLEVPEVPEVAEAATADGAPTARVAAAAAGDVRANELPVGEDPVGEDPVREEPAREDPLDEDPPGEDPLGVVPGDDDRPDEEPLQIVSTSGAPLSEPSLDDDDEAEALWEGDARPEELEADGLGAEAFEDEELDRDGPFEPDEDDVVPTVEREGGPVDREDLDEDPDEDPEWRSIAAAVVDSHTDVPEDVDQLEEDRADEDLDLAGTTDAEFPDSDLDQEDPDDPASQAAQSFDEELARADLEDADADETGLDDPDLGDEGIDLDGADLGGAAQDDAGLEDDLGEYADPSDGEASDRDADVVLPRAAAEEEAHEAPTSAPVSPMVVEPLSGPVADGAADEPIVEIVPAPNARTDDDAARQRTMFAGTDQELIEEAEALVLEYRRASANFLRRRLRVSMDEAVELLQELARRGVIDCEAGASQGRIVTGR